MSTVPRVSDGAEIQRTILPRRRRPLTLLELSKRIEPVIADWIAAAAEWPDINLGESKCVTFQTRLPGGGTFFVRFWSEPRSGLLCEIPSGLQDEPLREAMRSSAAAWAEQHGMEIQGAAENFRGRFAMDTDRAIAVLAELVVEAFVVLVNYQGLTPLVAVLVHDSRADKTHTLDSFSEEEVARVFQSLGFRVEPSAFAYEDGDEDPEFKCWKAGVESVVTMMDPLPGYRLYRRVRFSAELPITNRAALLSLKRGTEVTDDMNMVVISGIHAFNGGVTQAWLVERVAEWDIALAEHRRDMRLDRKAKSAAPQNAPPETVH